MHTAIRMISLLLRSFLFKPVPSFAVLLTHSFSHLAWKTQQPKSSQLNIYSIQAPTCQEQSSGDERLFAHILFARLPRCPPFSVFSASPLSFLIERCLLLFWGEGAVIYGVSSRDKQTSSTMLLPETQKALIVSVDEVCCIYWHFQLACLLLL